MASFNLLYQIYDVTVYQCKSNKRKAAFQLRLQTHRSRAAPTSGSHSQLSPRRSHFLFLAAMLKMHGLNHQRKERNHHNIYYEFQHHSKTEHRKKRISLQKPPGVITSGKSYLSLLSEYRGAPLPPRHLYPTAWFNINLPLGPQLKATAGKQNEIQQKAQLLSEGIWHYMEKAAKMKWL